MNTPTAELLDENPNQVPTPEEQRKAFLPTWIKVFAYIFLALTAIAILMNLLGSSFRYNLYGINAVLAGEAENYFFLALLSFKAISAYLLLTGNNWAVKIAIADAFLGITICFFTMLIFPMIDEEPGFALSINFELLLLIPYLAQMIQIQDKWENVSSQD